MGIKQLGSLIHFLNLGCETFLVKTFVIRLLIYALDSMSCVHAYYNIRLS